MLNGIHSIYFIIWNSRGFDLKVPYINVRQLCVADESVYALGITHFKQFYISNNKYAVLK